MQVSGKGRGFISNFSGKSSNSATLPSLSFTVPANTYFMGIIGHFGSLAAPGPGMSIVDDGTNTVCAIMSRAFLGTGSQVVAGNEQVLLGPGIYNITSNQSFTSSGYVYYSGALFKE